MKIRELLTEDETPLVITSLRKVLASGQPVFYVQMHEGALQIREIWQINPETELFSPGAPSDIANTPYTVISFRAPGYYSWKTTEVGTGRGNGTVPVPHVQQERYHIAKVKSVLRENGMDFVFGLKAYVNRWRLEHEDR